MTFHEYLSNHSPNHAFDRTITKWHTTHYGAQCIDRKKIEWDQIIDSFFNETEKSGFKKVEFPKTKTNEGAK